MTADKYITELLVDIETHYKGNCIYHFSATNRNGVCTSCLYTKIFSDQCHWWNGLKSLHGEAK